jgi:4-amino-4-deoxy-L-arabinose transferase-like glycosyltransferase
LPEGQFLMKKINPFHVFTAAVILLLVLPQMVQHGMFMDGTQYACVARNLVFGKGTFWNPHLSDSWSMNLNNSFQEHPPLVYALQSVFFLIMGDTIYAERLYSSFILMLCVYFICKIWEKVVPEKAESTAWLPVLLWFITPSVFWGFRSNVMENTLTLFVLIAVYFSFKSIGQTPKRLLFLFI